MVQPPLWISWASDIGSIFGAVATLILAIQAAQVKRKYQRLIKLNRHMVYFAGSLIELVQLIENYAVSSVGIQAWLGSTSDYLKSLAGECKDDDKQSVRDVLSSVKSVGGGVTQDGLMRVLGGVSEITKLVERMTEDAKISA